MTSEDLRATASRIVERMVTEHPAEAAVLASFVLSEILAVGPFGGGDPGEVDQFVLAVNTKLGEIALVRGARSSWQLVPGRAATAALINVRGNASRLPRRGGRVSSAP